MIFKILGALLVIWGLADLGLSYAGTDLWMDALGIQLEGVVYQYSAWAAMVIGAVVWSLGSSAADEEEDEA